MVYRIFKKEKENKKKNTPNEIILVDCQCQIKRKWCVEAKSKQQSKEHQTVSNRGLSNTNEMPSGGHKLHNDKCRIVGITIPTMNNIFYFFFFWFVVVCLKCIDVCILYCMFEKCISNDCPFHIRFIHTFIHFFSHFFYFFIQ